jgi:hypothetical protein
MCESVYEITKCLETCMANCGRLAPCSLTVTDNDPVRAISVVSDDVNSDRNVCAKIKTASSFLKISVYSVLYWCYVKHCCS